MDTVVELLPDISVETPADSGVRWGHIRPLPQTIHSISGMEITMSVKTHLAIEANRLSIKYASMEQLGKPGTA
jgi:hypothetical protein